MSTGTPDAKRRAATPDSAAFAACERKISELEHSLADARRQIEELKALLSTRFTEDEARELVELTDDLRRQIEERDAHADRVADICVRLERAVEEALRERDEARRQIEERDATIEHLELTRDALSGELERWSAKLVEQRKEQAAMIAEQARRLEQLQDALSRIADGRNFGSPLQAIAAKALVLHGTPRPTPATSGETKAEVFDRLHNDPSIMRPENDWLAHLSAPQPPADLVERAEAIYDDGIDCGYIQEAKDSNPTPFVDSIAAALAAERAEATRRAVNLIRDPNGVIYDAALSVGDLSLALDIADYIESSLATPEPRTEGTEG